VNFVESDDDECSGEQVMGC